MARQWVTREITHAGSFDGAQGVRRSRLDGFRLFRIDQLLEQYLVPGRVAQREEAQCVGAQGRVTVAVSGQGSGAVDGARTIRRQSRHAEKA
jgi:hypothetical protein